MSDFWKGKRILVTGHTGFKGSWLTLWLKRLGAEVTGLALPPATNPALFEQLRLADEIVHHLCDIAEAAELNRIVDAAQPEIVFHLAAQSLVRRSYREPAETWRTNVMGTIHLLEALRGLNAPCAAVMITTDKVYLNHEWVHAYRENDALGGYDPYSASKAGAEIAIASWRSAFCPPGGTLAIASARAGNVIGGGDWAEDRLVPDLIRALETGKPLTVRNPLAKRPWQHVLEPLGGYLLLAEKMSSALSAGDPNLGLLTGVFNFGPHASSNRSVADLVREAFRVWPGEMIHQRENNTPHEAQELNLAVEKAYHRLGWVPRWDFEDTVRQTIGWYKDVNTKGPTAARHACLAQIIEFSS
ncbi:MAG TPA: CDP-glucose 4,6-dehydratase [Rhizomicrobium sp.]|nr:CDP-glucose 4,6-dehydratase [Rhizomicrobium sp.]